jgi:hypothetical protein
MKIAILTLVASFGMLVVMSTQCSYSKRPGNTTPGDTMYYPSSMEIRNNSELLIDKATIAQFKQEESISVID